MKAHWRTVAAQYLRDERRLRNGSTRSWEVFRRAALSAAEEAAFLLNRSRANDSPSGWEDSAAAIDNAAAWAYLDERTTRALNAASAGGPR